MNIIDIIIFSFASGINIGYGFTLTSNAGKNKDYFSLIWGMIIIFVGLFTLLHTQMLFSKH